jgi:hypothetical protein
LGRGGAAPLNHAITGPGPGIEQLISATPGPGPLSNCKPLDAVNVELMKATLVADDTPDPVGKKISESSQALIVPPPMKSSVPSMKTFLK